MGYSARILADHLAPSGSRLTTFEITFPRIVLAEFNTHRVLSRNSASSRAIPVEKMIDRVRADPFIPTYWGKNQKGMQAEQELDAADRHDAEYAWRSAAGRALAAAQELLKIGVHKQLVNRLLEPFMWQTVIVTATEWDNFFALRNHADAQPEIREIASRMEELYRSSTPKEVPTGYWHMPLLNDLEVLRSEGYTEDQLRLISVGRCARVSYLTHDGKRDPQADLDLCKRLQASGHMSPFEHVAMARGSKIESGNFRGWTQLRKRLPNEAVYRRETT